MGEINSILIIFMMLNAAAVVYWVLRGQSMQNSIFNDNINKGEDLIVENTLEKKEVDCDERGKDSLV